MSDNKKEMVNHPTHYQGNKFEVIDIIEDFNLDFHLGNVVKYVLRCGKKDDDIQELKKAKWYLDKKIELLEKQQILESVTYRSNVELSNREESGGFIVGEDGVRGSSWIINSKGEYRRYE